eukprot:16915-Heterococcus_DN1.PRE.1
MVVQADLSKLPLRSSVLATGVQRVLSKRLEMMAATIRRLKQLQAGMAHRGQPTATDSSTAWLVAMSALAREMEYTMHNLQHIECLCGGRSRLGPLNGRSSSLQARRSAQGCSIYQEEVNSVLHAARGGIAINAHGSGRCSGTHTWGAVCVAMQYYTCVGTMLDIQPEVQCIHGTHQRSCVDTFSNSKQPSIAAV